jgi:hypothetical protein
MLQYLIVLLVFLIMLMIWKANRQEKMDNSRTDEIIDAVAHTVKNNGSIVDFGKLINRHNFSPLAYATLTDHYRKGKLTRDIVHQIM